MRRIMKITEKELRQIVREELKNVMKEDEGDDEDPCWDNYKMVGTKEKNGKEVPNCVPKDD